MKAGDAVTWKYADLNIKEGLSAEQHKVSVQWCLEGGTLVSVDDDGIADVLLGGGSNHMLVLVDELLPVVLH